MAKIVHERSSGSFPQIAQRVTSLTSKPVVSGIILIIGRDYFPVRQFSLSQPSPMGLESFIPCRP
jgi:hypothetical protein